MQRTLRVILLQLRLCLLWPESLFHQDNPQTGQLSHLSVANHTAPLLSKVQAFPGPSNRFIVLGPRFGLFIVMGFIGSLWTFDLYSISYLPLLCFKIAVILLYVFMSDVSFQ